MNLFYISSFILIFLALIGLGVSNFLIFQNLSFFLEYKFYGVNSADFVMVFLLDWKSTIFLSTVLFISGVVVLYSKSYMASDLNSVRFLFLVILFVLSMILMIVSPNLISILLGWDGLGLISYCLVIYYQNVKSYNAGMLTILSNRVGDAAILLSIAWMLNYGSWNFYLYLDFMDKDNMMSYIGVLVILAAMTKSAQVPFSAWLPAAMAAPTPVSALVHSSTLVTAGVYLLIRFSPLLENSYLFKCLMMIGVLTMFVSGLGANFEYDLKKIIALSTLSQLGLMMCILGAGFSNLAFFHLLTHAFFKSLLFLCAGILIHSFGDMQDIRYMGNSVKFMPLTCGIFNVANMALCGLPFLAGFYSKDLILEINLMTSLNALSFFLCYLSTGLTVCYSVRIFYWSFISEFNFLTLINLHDEDWTMIAGMGVLLALSIAGGAGLIWLIIPIMEVVYLPMYLKFLVVGVILAGLVLGILVNYFYLLSTFRVQLKFLDFIGGIWFLPHLATYGVNGGALKMGEKFKSVLDLGWTEELIVLNLERNSRKFMSFYQVMHMNNLKIYTLIFVSWIFLVIMIYISLV
uniref:NADH-ubiquinone oxidoreductase chain 5 n=1 Tax=Pseudopotamorites peniculus TaxID=2904919 RepID=A0A9E8LP86_9NEOP|nr:NADH dehydrogenase subunit 5 [Pseudopotamorites peniculus]UZZ44306.1 NADH dehydrogenase subunit 5 [Pseudopotamorites peniculus]